MASVRLTPTAFPPPLALLDLPLDWFDDPSSPSMTAMPPQPASPQRANETSAVADRSMSVAGAEAGAVARALRAENAIQCGVVHRDEGCVVGAAFVFALHGACAHRDALI